MTSPSLRNKIEQQRRAAQRELPKTRLCAEVVLTLVSGQQELDSAVQQLKDGLGRDWSVVRAFQFMSGRQALLAAEAGEEGEQPGLMLAHQVAAKVSPVTKGDLAQLRAMCVTAAANLHQKVKDH